MNIMELSDEQLIAQALTQWANYIETGDSALTARDAADAKLSYNALSLDQMKLIIRLREMASNFNAA